MITQVLRRGMRDQQNDGQISEWQWFLVGQNVDAGTVDGIFGANTERATKAFQRVQNLNDDGVVGRQTLAKAMGLGLGHVPDPDNEETNGPNWPPKPDFSNLSPAEREVLFGKFSYVPEPQPNNAENIRILGDWVAENIQTIDVPQLVGKKGANAKGQVTCHRRAADQIRSLFAAWERAGLLDRVLSWEGCFNARFVRGSRTALSNHSFGSGFDINAAYNAYGCEPARAGEKGSVRELVEIANALGFYWGGHFSSRLDGMHFEVAKLVEVGDSKPPNRVPPVGIQPLTGSAFYEQIRTMAGNAREEAIFNAITQGSAPAFLQNWQEVHLSATDSTGRTHVGVVQVSPDYLSVGTDDDFLRVPMNPLTAQRIANASDCLLPTAKLVDLIYAQAALKLTPKTMPPCPEMTTSPYYKRHNDYVEAQRANRGMDDLIAGHKKDVVITNRLLWKDKKVAIYGWHEPNGKAIQPLSTIHEDTYADYSHGIRLVKGDMEVDGKVMRTSDVLEDSKLCVLLSNEGALKLTKYPGV